MRTPVIILLALACAVSGKTLWHQLDDSYTFDKYCAEFGKRYDVASPEYAQRRELFNSNLARVMKHNADATKTWKEGVNQFTDRTVEEFKQLLGYKKSMGYASRGDGLTGVHFPAEGELKDAVAALPASVDWRDKGAVTAIKDQGQCGSCWTFASAETMESAYFLKTGLLSDLSEQQIASCTSNPEHCGGTGGCEGGTAEVAYASIIKAGGLSSEWTYPYVSYTGSDFACKLTPTSVFAANISSYVQLGSNEAMPLLTALANVGPVAITVDASSWAAYESGVYNGCNQVNPDLDHNVQCVGYGTDPTLGDYWLVRNSWSVTWGEKGYIRLFHEDATKPPTCGIDKRPQDGSGCDNGPSTVTVCGTCGILYDNVYPVVK